MMKPNKIEKKKVVSPFTGEAKYYDWQIGYYIKGLPNRPRQLKTITKWNYKRFKKRINLTDGK